MQCNGLGRELSAAETKHLRRGDLITVPQRGVTDWMMVCDGALVGGESLRLALQQVSRLRPLSAERISHLPSNARRFLSVTERSRVVLVPIDDVIFLKAELKYITIRTKDREFLLEESLTRLEQEFGHRFVRVHRNCLVARDAVRGFDRRVNDDGDAHWEVLLNGLDETIPVSRRQQGIVRELSRESVG